MRRERDERRGLKYLYRTQICYFFIYLRGFLRLSQRGCWKNTKSIELNFRHSLTRDIDILTVSSNLLGVSFDFDGDSKFFWTRLNENHCDEWGWKAFQKHIWEFFSCRTRSGFVKICNSIGGVVICVKKLCELLLVSCEESKMSEV